MHRCWFVTLDPEYPSWLSPLTGSRTSGPAIFAIYLLLVIGLTGESQAEHKRMLFMDAWKKGKGKGETFLRWQPLLDFSIAIRSIAVRNRRFRVFRTKFFHSELWDRVLFEFLILYPSIGIRCLSWRDWGRKKGRFLRGDCFQKGKFRLLVSVSDDILSRWRVRDESNLNSLKYVWIWLNDILRLNCWLELIQI